MIDDPIVIRKSRGLLVVSSSIPTDPIQLVRELSHDKLEVHLKNGSKYIEELQNGDNIQELILEMMGYGIMEAVFSFNAWPDPQVGQLEFYEDQKDMVWIGKSIVDDLFSPTPYMNSKFLSMELDDVDETPNITYYDDKYSRYIVTYSVRFRARVDHLDKINNLIYDNMYSIAHSLITRNGRRNAGAGVNDYNVKTSLLNEQS